MVSILRLLIPLLFLYSCEQKNIGVIHWSTHFQQLSKEKKYADSLGEITPWMVRYFDVVWENQQATPTAVTHLPENFPILSSAIYIQRQVIENTPKAELPKLSKKIISMIQQMEKISHSYSKEILIDFDWRKKTKSKYFELIAILKKSFPTKVVSTTIRLSQFANPKVFGVPPSSKGLLMMYQTGSLNHPEQPLLWEKSEVQSYLKQTSYPISLDVAIPTFSWSRIQRKMPIQNKTRGSLIFPSYSNELENDKDFKQNQPNQFICTKAHFFHGFFLLPGDRVFPEKVSENDLKWAIEEANSITQNRGKVYLYLIEEASNGNYPANWFR